MNNVIKFPNNIIVKALCPCCKIQFKFSLFEHTESVQCPKCNEYFLVDINNKNKIMDEYDPEGDA